MARRPLPLPAPPRPYVMVPALGAGVIGTALLFKAATHGRAWDLVLGTLLLAAGLLFAGWPFVLATLWVRRARELRRQGASKAP